MYYYAQRKSVKDGVPQPINNRFGERDDMEYQYHLYCASAVKNNDLYELDAIEWGTIEQGAIERKRYTHEIPAPEPEPEPEPEVIDNGEEEGA